MKEADGKAEAPGAGFGQGLSILLVDDDELVRNLVEGLLVRDGFTVNAVATYAEAMEQLGRSSPDLAVVDLNLPDGNGLDIAQYIDARGLDCEVAILTGFATLESAIEAMRVRVADYLIKPIRVHQIRDRLNRLVEHITLRRQVATQSETIARLEAQATRDSLTGLFNHSYFQQQLEHELARCRRYQHPASLLFIDVDNFKQVNDECGHQAGDRVLTMIAAILAGRSRDSDLGFRLREHDLAARYGGDEFVLLLPETDKVGASVTAERLRQVVENSDFEISPALPVTLSVGLAEFPGDAGDKNTLVNSADVALYAAKSTGRNRIVAYSPNLTPERPAEGWSSIVDLQRVEALEQLLASGRAPFGFACQPIVEVKTERVFGQEVLCRPGDPLFPGPAELLHTAAQVGKLTNLGRQLRQQVADMVGRTDGDQLLFVNLHPMELHDPQLCDPAAPLSRRAGRVVFEINNSRNIRDQNRLRRVLGRLRELGFRILLDDLCQGYLGLNSLVRLQPQFVKTNIEFLRQGQGSQRAGRLVRHFLDTAAGEGVKVIATGIENDRHRQVAVYNGCSYLQGYLLGRPRVITGSRDADGNGSTAPAT